MTKVSIITPCYNQAQYLPETLDSVLAQSYKDWECVIVDDGSTDNTKAVASQYEEQDQRFKYLYQENQGPSVARNFGIQNSDGEFILPLDADDLIGKEYLQEAVEIFAKNPKTKLVYCKAELFGKQSGSWNIPKYNYEALLWTNMIFCSAMYKREDYDKTSGYNSNMKDGLEDWDFWLSLIKRDDVVYQIPKVLFSYRIKDNSRNDDLDDENEKVKNTHRQIYNNHRELYEDSNNPIYDQYRIRKRDKMIQSMENSKFHKLRNFCIKIKGFLKQKI